jgi:hypothetical protein
MYKTAVLYVRNIEIIDKRDYIEAMIDAIPMWQVILIPEEIMAVYIFFSCGTDMYRKRKLYTNIYDFRFSQW